MSTRPGTTPGRPSADQSGSVSIEFTLLAGLLAVVGLGLVQLAFFGYAREAAGYAAHDTLNEATAYDGSVAAAQDLGTQMLGQLTDALQHPQVTVSEHGHEAVVTVTGQTKSLLGIAETVTVTDAGPVQVFGAGG